MPTDAPRAPASRYRLALILAFVSGWGMSAQSRMNGEVSSVLGAPAQAAVWSFGSGLVLLGLATLLSARVRRGIGRIAAALRGERLRWWQCLGGIGGGFFVAVQTAAVPLVGVAIFTVATVAGQTATGLLVDRLGIGPGGRRPILLSRVIAAVLAVAGVGVTVSGSLGEGGLSPLPVVLAVVAGAGLALQQGVNGRVNLVSRDVLATTGQNFLTGTAFLVVLLGVQWLRGAYEPVSFAGVPWWAWWGGCIGVVFIAVAAWAVQHLGVLVFGLALLSGQIVSALAIDLAVPTAGHEVTLVMAVGAGVTLAAATVAGWFARPTRTAPHPSTLVKG